MYEKYWGLTRTPFAGSTDPDWFWNGPAYDEALARFEFLADGHRPGGLLVGPAGSGKTLLLKVFVRRMQRKRRPAALVNLGGMDEPELLWEISAQLGLAPELMTAEFELWRRVHDRIVENGLQQFGTLLAFDDADTADGPALRLIERLCGIDCAGQPLLTCVFAWRRSRRTRTRAGLARLTELRVELPPLDNVQTTQYVTVLLERAGRREPVFDDGALAALHEFSEGIPRRINRLCDLSLAAGAASGLTAITSDVVQSVQRELEGASPRPAPALV
ncbi:MAG: ExeA family protein, partial [Pirellulales bacterium]